MASQRSCGAFLPKGASRACSRKPISAKKHQRAVTARDAIQAFARAPRRASRECTGPPARAQSRQGMHRAPSPSTIPRIPLPAAMHTPHYQHFTQVDPHQNEGDQLTKSPDFQMRPLQQKEEDVGKVSQTNRQLTGQSGSRKSTPRHSDARQFQSCAPVWREDF